ncbi:MAG: hypothetical protein EBT75_02110 [Proteobacteria bacterium]|nr:hypothetical protein [Pseudomonadota bacterium]
MGKWSGRVAGGEHPSGGGEDSGGDGGEADQETSTTATDAGAKACGANWLDHAGVGRHGIAGGETFGGRSGPDILLVDSTGELRDLYPACELVFIGKTVTGTGGQNFLEAARHGRAIVAGPHMENFMTLRREFEEAQAIRVAGSATELEGEVDRLLENQEERSCLGRRALECFQGHLGAGKRCAEILAQKISQAERVTRQT